MICSNKWMFPKIGVGPQNGWFIMKHPIKMGIKMDDLRVPFFFGNTQIVLMFDDFCW